MCLMVPGRVIAINSDVATVDYDVETREGKIIDTNVRVGDYVLLSGGIVADKIEEEEAKEALALFKKSLESE